VPLSAAAETGATWGGPIVATVKVATLASRTVVKGPGILGMAFSAMKSMAKFLGLGLQTASQETRQERLRVCAECEHHTGLRCRLCGCFMDVKARLLHEECPIGKRPA